MINIRSYGEDPEQVSAHVQAFIEGAHSDPNARVLVTAKHFPGHGDTDVDSHIGLPRLPVGRDRMEVMELKPFRAAIADGVDSIMTAHMAVPELDNSGMPATVSPKVLTDLLRKDLGFNGIIVTDAMNSRIQVFDQNGKFIKQWTHFGTPWGVSIRGNRLYVVDGTKNNVLYIANLKDGKVIEKVEGLNNATAVTADSKGNLYLGEVTGTNVRKLVRK